MTRRATLTPGTQHQTRQRASRALEGLKARRDRVADPDQGASSDAQGDNAPIQWKWWRNGGGHARVTSRVFSSARMIETESLG